MEFIKEYSYSDIYLKPQKCIVNSRSECDTSVVLGKRIFKMPVYPSNMKSVVNQYTCAYLASKGWFYSMHRFDVELEQFARYMTDLNYFVSISLGINLDSKENFERMVKAGFNPEYITIDVANAWTERVKDTIKMIQDSCSSFIIVGNVSCAEAVDELADWGADACKCGQAVGKVCTTRNKTGFSGGIVSNIIDCVENTKSDIPIIADGGVGEHGDIAKSLSLGSYMVMCGSLFAGYDQSAGDIISFPNEEHGEIQYKEYYGSASEHNKGEYRNIEGKKIMIPYRGDMYKLLIELREDLQSSISYAGVRDLDGLRRMKKLIVINK